MNTQPRDRYTCSLQRPKCMNQKLCWPPLDEAASQPCNICSRTLSFHRSTVRPRRRHSPILYGVDSCLRCISSVIGILSCAFLFSRLSNQSRIKICSSWNCNEYHDCYLPKKVSNQAPRPRDVGGANVMSRGQRDGGLWPLGFFPRGYSPLSLASSQSLSPSQTFSRKPSSIRRSPQKTP